MFNVCSKCGLYHVDKIIDENGPYAVCPACGHKHKFKKLPLFIITGASGAGKSTICLELSRTVSQVIVMESDMLWRSEFNHPENNYREYRELWLRVCKNISQGGTPVVLCGSAVPEQFEQCIERRYFSNLHYLAVVCEDEALAERLKARPTYRNCGDDEFIKSHLQFNNWFKSNHDKVTPSITLLDTTKDSVEESIKKINRWISEGLENEKIE
jgi:adenylate kinase family enzyme/DNA-directed RNA polymerase subunit RPC12/RpoP